MKGKHIYVLGTGYSHDGSACLLKDGEIVVAIEKERISRVKHDGGNDTAAIQYCLDAAGITIHDVDLVVQNGAGAGPATDYYEGPRLFTKEVEVPIYDLSHHLAHAYSAVGTCPFDTDFNVMVIDGSGSSYDQCIDLQGIIPDTEKIHALPHLYFEKDSYYSYRDGKLQTLYKDFSEFGFFFQDREKYTGNMHSIGGVYEMFSKYCFSNINDTGKLMGLGPYGEKGKFTAPLFELRDGRAFVNYNTINTFRHPARSFANFKKNFQYYADIAYWVQEEVEKAVLYTFASRLEQAPTTQLCYAGGVALNAVANAKLFDKLDLKRLYMQPAAGDNGIAIGCAYYGWLEVLKKERVMHSGSAFLGRSYAVKEMETAVNNFTIYDLADTKIMIENYLGTIKSYNTNIDLSGKVLQLNITDIGVYQLSFLDGQILLHNELKSIPTSAITIEGKHFLRGMRDMSYFTMLNVEGKLNLQSPLEIQDIIRAVDFSGLAGQQPEPSAGQQLFNVHKAQDLPTEVATLLAAGEVIALFSGGSEFGPRALGHRSIIADPRTPGVRDYINTRIKLREDFRPFAPAVLEEDLLVYFKKQQDTPYMILVNEVREEWVEQLKSVIHRNNSARVQTVNRAWNSQFYDILSAFGKLTGISVLLNTSFNRKGMPIVETPAEALQFFWNSELDYLIIDDYIISKQDAIKGTNAPELVAEAGSVPA